MRSGCGVVWELVWAVELWVLGADVGVGFVGWVVVVGAGVSVDVGELGLAVGVCVGAGVGVWARGGC